MRRPVIWLALSQALLLLVPAGLGIATARLVHDESAVITKNTDDWIWRQWHSIWMLPELYWHGGNQIFPPKGNCELPEPLKVCDL